ncbi:phosphinothricin acetyltransferase [Saonia flava]|uniref:Phosphinothricin acetyltransferase n=1 Tax=Saonia flava TaxID=523696 RepID=A0A846R267_9FLAO|nr:GNAT family N-acetyltransferase [Saonia flava]NJB71474.1 phosphinothricin acetyltransferase [Saonia flava]
MPNQLLIRPAILKDVPEILTILNHEIKNSTVIYDYTERTLNQQTQWFYTKQEAKMPILVAEKESNILGFGSFGIYRPWEAYKFSIEHSIYVSSASRGLGIGKLLMEELIILAKLQGYHTMIAGVDADNKESYKFHEKFGFKEVGRFNEVGYKFDRWLDLIFMQLHL